MHDIMDGVITNSYYFLVCHHNRSCKDVICFLISKISSMWSKLNGKLKGRKLKICFIQKADYNYKNSRDMKQNQKKKMLKIDRKYI